MNVKPILVFAPSILLAGLLPHGCATGPRDPALADARVQWAGAMHAAVQEGDTAAKVNLRDLLARPHLNAVGPVEGLRGEITVIDGRPSIAAMVGERTAVSEDADVGAAFLAWAYVREWEPRPLPASVRTDADLEAHLASLVGPEEAPVAFRLEGTAEHIAYHIIWHEPDTPAGHDAHDRAKVRREAANLPVSIVGFYAPAHTGVFIPRGRTAHLHAVAGGGLSGHVDALRLAPGATLLLPR